jgi:hypothetical protein
MAGLDLSLTTPQFPDSCIEPLRLLVWRRCRRLGPINSAGPLRPFYRSESGRVLATLVRLFGDLELCRRLGAELRRPVLYETAVAPARQEPERPREAARGIGKSNR